MKFKLVEATNKTILVRGDSGNNYSDLHKVYGGKFFIPYEEWVDSFMNDGQESEYGKLSKWELSLNAKIYNGNNSMDFVQSKQQEFTKNQKAIISHMISDSTNIGDDDKKHIIKNDFSFDSIDELSANGIAYGLDLAIWQYVAKDILDKQGYDGAYWKWEDDLTPEQYQIWNLDKIKRI